MMLFLRNAVFLLVVPGTVAVWAPLLMNRGRPAASGVVLVLALAVLAAGAAVCLWCIRDFAVLGRGTPLPLDPPKSLVVRGLYRYVRNPMYAGVLTVLLGWLLLYRTRALVVYVLVVAACFQLFVVVCEEPHLARTFGADYEQYRARVGRWLPRMRRAGSHTVFGGQR
jgi:protein-S-isoprenylcysteine O-methyltransferase Ste14